jgi:hypothetical protein
MTKEIHQNPFLFLSIKKQAKFDSILINQIKKFTYVKQLQKYERWKQILQLYLSR